MNLKDELKREKYADMNDEEAASDLNELKVAQVGEIDPPTFIRWCARYNGIRRLKEAQLSIDKKVQSIADAALFNLEVGQNFDLGDPEIAGMYQYLVSKDIFTQAEADDLVSLATRMVSRAVELGLGVITTGDVYRARHGD